MIRKTLLLLASVVIFSLTANAAQTYYSKLTVKTADTAKGKVYVSAKEATNPTYKEEASATNSAEGTDGSATTKYYLYAKPENGYVLDYWSINENGSTRNVEASVPTYDVKAENTNKSTPTSVVLYAFFRETPPVSVICNNERLGKAYIKNPTNNNLDKSLTVVAEYTHPSKWTSGDFLGVTSKSVKFDGWFVKGTDECKSTALTYTFTIKEPVDLEARFSYKQYISGTDGYYRVKCSFNAYTTVAGAFPVGSEKYLSIEGNYNIGFSNGRDITPCIHYSNNPYSDPSNILRITGKNYKSLNEADYKSQVTVLENVNLAGQGTSTHGVTDTYFKILSTEQIGLYKLVYSSYCLYNGYEGKDAPLGALTIGRNYQTGEEAMRSFDFLPIDEKHIDEYFFAAEPDEDMWFDGGYWTSMYTSFPYDCNWGDNFEGDGVEAYYVLSVLDEYDEPIAVLEKIEDGLVPAETAVLLKCKSLDPKQNRLLPLLEDVDATYDNLLDGSYQLNMNNNKDDTGKEKFKSTTMKVLDVKDGEVGFYNIEEGTLLTANKAWLNIENINVSRSKISLKTSSSTVVEGVSVAESTEEADAPVYNLMGQKVRNLVPGQIYIKNGKKFIAR